MTSYPFDNVIDRRHTASIKWEKYGDENVIPMWVADMDFAIAPEIIEALQSRLEHPVLGYTQAPQSLYTAISQYLLDNYQWQIDASWLVWLPGVVPGLTVACEAAGQPGDAVLVPVPVYHPLLHIPGKVGQQRVDVPLIYADNRWSIDFDALIHAANTSKPSSLLLCSPHNPVGTVFRRDELRQLMEICSERNIVVVSDEIHCDLVLDPALSHVPTAIAAGELAANTITLMSPSKTFNLAGANCSFAIIPDPALREKFSSTCQYRIPIMPTLSYTAAEAAYSRGEPWRQQLLGYLRHNHATLRATIDELPFLSMDDTAATYLAWINTSQMPVDDPCDYFRQHGVGLSPGAQFGDGDFQRLNFACPNSRLQDALARIRSAVEALRQ